jgi:hypothetical protein
MARPLRKIIPSSKLTADNVGELELTSHRRAIASTALIAPASELASTPLPESSPPPPTDTEDASSITADSSQAQRALKRPSQSSLSLDRSTFSFDSVIVISPTTTDDAPDTAPKAKKAKPTLAPGDSLAQSLISTTLKIRGANYSTKQQQPPTLTFFSMSSLLKKIKRKRTWNVTPACELSLFISLKSPSTVCYRKGIGCAKKESKILVNKTTTLQRHLASFHLVRSQISILLIPHRFDCLPSASTKSGVMQATLSQCCHKTPRNGRRPLQTVPKKPSSLISEIILAPPTQILSHIVTGYLRRLRLSG